jgi:hypothetical protein
MWQSTSAGTLFFGIASGRPQVAGITVDWIEITNSIILVEGKRQPRVGFLSYRGNSIALVWKTWQYCRTTTVPLVEQGGTVIATKATTLWGTLSDYCRSPFRVFDSDHAALLSYRVGIVFIFRISIKAVPFHSFDSWYQRQFDCYAIATNALDSSFLVTWSIGRFPHALDKRLLLLHLIAGEKRWFIQSCFNHVLLEKEVLGTFEQQSRRHAELESVCMPYFVVCV